MVRIVNIDNEFTICKIFCCAFRGWEFYASCGAGSCRTNRFPEHDGPSDKNPQ